MIGSGFERRSESTGGPDATVPGPRVRIYELAKELGLSNRDLVARIQGSESRLRITCRISRAWTSIGCGDL